MDNIHETQNETKLLSFCRDNEARILSIKLTIDLNGKLLLLRERKREREKASVRKREREQLLN